MCANTDKGFGVWVVWYFGSGARLLSGFGFRVRGFGFKFGFKVRGLGSTAAQGLGFRGSGFKAQGAGLRLEGFRLQSLRAGSVPGFLRSILFDPGVKSGCCHVQGPVSRHPSAVSQSRTLPRV